MLPMIIVPAETQQEGSGDIAFQPDILAEIKFSHYDYKFYISYKKKYIAIEPFVVYSSKYYSMKKVQKFLLNRGYNITYVPLVKKILKTVHWGFNYTKIPQVVRDKIDFFGFRLVDYNFPLHWLKLEEVEMELGVNMTLIHIPKIALTFSFEDLYPYGYSIEHINSTYMLIGNVRGRESVYLDPITYSSNIITVVGYTSGSPAGFDDVYNADIAGNRTLLANTTIASTNGTWAWREHKSYGVGSPVFTFTKSDGTTARSTTTTSSMGDCYLFDDRSSASLNNTFIYLTWQGAYTYEAPTYWIEIYDGIYDRTNDTQWPDGGWPLGLPPPLWQRHENDSATGIGSKVRRAYGPMVLNYTKTNSTIIVRMVDSWSGQSGWLDVDRLQWYDTDNTTLLEDHHFVGTITMERTGTTGDYGYIGSTSTKSLTTQVTPADSLALKLNLTVTGLVTAGWINVTGTDIDGNAQTEQVTISADGNYTTTNWFRTVDTNGIVCAGKYGLEVWQDRWGVVWRMSSAQYTFDAKLYLGDGTSGGQAWFADKDKQITFNDIVSVGSEILFYVRRYSHLTLGTLIDATDKSTKEGCSVTSLADPRCYLIRNEWAPVDTFLYGCSLINGGAYIPYGTTRMYNCLVSKGGLRGPVDGFNILIADVGTAFAYGFPAAGERFYFFDATWLLYIHMTHYTTGREIYARNYTYLARFAANWQAYVRFINCDFDDWGFDWYSVSTGIVYRQYTFDLNVTFANRTAIQNANVTVSHYGESAGQDFTVMTGANGSFATQTLTVGTYNNTGKDVIYDYNPYNITIMLDGYQTYTKNFTLSDKTDWRIALTPAVTPSPAYWFPMFVIGIILFIASVTYYIGWKRR